MLSLPRLVVVLAAMSLLVGGCSDDPTPPGSPGESATPSPSTSDAVELTAREWAAQLATSAPNAFDATYRLDSKGNGPDATVRMRAVRDRFRLDIERSESTAVLISSGRGVVSCQVATRRKNKPPDRSCFLVAKHLNGVPPLFDPEVQGLFRTSTSHLASPHSDVKVTRAGHWTAPGQLGPAACFNVRGPDVENGKYCYLSQPGPLIGLLARAVFTSGSLNLRSVKRVVRPDSFKPPTSPTPLPR